MMSDIQASQPSAPALKIDVLQGLRTRIDGVSRRVPKTTRDEWWLAFNAALDLDADPDMQVIMRRAVLKSSMDSALKVLETRLPGCGWAVEREQEPGGRFTYWCDLVIPGASGAPDETIVVSNSASAAYALLSALLEVLIREEMAAAVQTGS